MDNIYSDYGKVILNDRYIHRIQEKEIKKHLNGGIVSIVGMPRVGKTSMVENLLKNEKLFIKITFAMLESADDFFKNMVKKFYKKAKKLGYNFEEEYEDFKNDGNAKEAFFEFFDFIGDELEDMVYFFVDEFDYAEKMLSRSYLETLRAIFTQEKSTKDKFNLILVSRRKLFEIEGAESVEGSTLAGVTNEKFLSLYKDNEIDEYFSILRKYVEVNDSLIEKYRKFTGFHPYLSDIISFELVEGLSIEEAIEKNRVKFYEYFSYVYKILDEKDLSDALISVLLKLPFKEVYKIDILKNYGIIDENYSVFSEIFLEDYLKNKMNVESFTNIWYKTENYLRKFVKCVLSEKYKNLEEVKRKYQNEKFLKDALFYSSMQRKSKISQTKNIDFIEGLSTSGLFKIILLEWIFFESYFKCDDGYIKESSKFITEVRNFISHNKEIDSKNIQKAAMYCEEIIEIIENYFKLNKCKGVKKWD